MKFDFIRFFVGFAGGSFLVQMVVIPYPLWGSIFIGLIIGILLEQCMEEKENE